MANYKNARPQGQPVGIVNPEFELPGQIPGKSKFVESRVNQGMITMIDPAEIPQGSGQLARNLRFRYDKMTRRPGTVLLTPTKPDLGSVNGIAFFKKNSGETFFIRFTPTTINYIAGASWQALAAGVGGSLTGSVSDRFQCITVLDRFFFTNGIDPIQEFDSATGEYIQLGPVAQYFKYMTGFYERIVAAHKVDPIDLKPSVIAWSGQNNLGIFDPLVDESAGSSPLIDSTSDLSDYITGIFGFTSNMVVLREHSVVLANKQPIPQNPFYFYTAFPGLGCDCPHSAVVVPNGLIWTDRRTGTVWRYSPGGAPERLGAPIEKDLMQGLSDQSRVFASYNSIQGEYTVCIPLQAWNGVVAWTYNERTNAWSKDEYEAVTTIADEDMASAIITIDDLGDIPIDELVGTIDDLSPDNAIVPTRVLGRSDGEIIVEDINTYVDPPVPSSVNTTGKFTSEFISMSFTQPTYDTYFAEVRIEYVPYVSAPMTLYYSRNGGKTFHPVGKTYTPTASQLGETQLFRRVKNILARRFAFKLVMEDGQFEVLGYEIHVHRGGESKT